ncbi:MAG: hypothetical protein JRN15_11035 [Nitrososphaerota archaeon]|nr:hypothetical protein [Nitrososphaerota archaeon]
MRSRNAFLVILVLFSTVAFCTSGSGLLPHANASSSASGYSLLNLQTFNQYGQFSINETLTGSNSSTPLSSVTFGFPASFQNHLVSPSSSASIGSSPIATNRSITVSNGTVFITLNFAQDLGSNSEAQLGFWVLDSLKPVNTTGYIAPALTSPSVSIHLDMINNTINFPDATTYISNSTTLQAVGFTSSNTYVETSSYSGQIQHWTNTSSNVEPSMKSIPINIYSLPSSTGALNFTSITRQISISASGQILVTDTLEIRNLGLNTISSLAYTPLTSSENVTAVPAREPPLSNFGIIAVTGGQLDLNSTNQAIQPESSETLIYEYPLSSHYWSVSNGVYTLTIPTTVPVGGLVNQFRLYSAQVPGIVLIGQQLSLNGSGTMQIGSGSTSLKFRVGVASAAAQALPVASILFVGVFVAGLIFRPRSETGEDIGTTFDSMIRTIEDKVSSTNDLLSELRSKGSSIGRNELAVVRSRIDDVRTKTNSRLGSLRSQLPGSVTTAVQAGINEILAIDRDFDRIVRDILNSYDQYASKRMKDETFSRVQQSDSRKLQSITNSLIDRAHDIREEYESER